MIPCATPDDSLPFGPPFCPSIFPRFSPKFPDVTPPPLPAPRQAPRPQIAALITRIRPRPDFLPISWWTGFFRCHGLPTSCVPSGISPDLELANKGLAPPRYPGWCVPDAPPPPLKTVPNKGPSFLSLREVCCRNPPTSDPFFS